MNHTHRYTIFRCRTNGRNILKLLNTLMNCFQSIILDFLEFRINVFTYFVLSLTAENVYLNYILKSSLNILFIHATNNKSCHFHIC